MGLTRGRGSLNVIMRLLHRMMNLWIFDRLPAVNQCVRVVVLQTVFYFLSAVNLENSIFVYTHPDQ